MIEYKVQYHSVLELRGGVQGPLPLVKKDPQGVPVGNSYLFYLHPPSARQGFC